MNSEICEHAYPDAKVAPEHPSAPPNSDPLSAATANPSGQDLGEFGPTLPTGHSALRVLIVADNASEDYGGEAVLPLRYFEGLRARGVEVWMITHARVRPELTARMPASLDRVSFIEDRWIHRTLWRLGQPLDHRLRHVTTEFISRLVTQRAQRRVARSLIRRHGIDVVHQPTPVSPREPSLLSGLGVPVVFGPMNGATDFPPAFRTQESGFTRALLSIGRRLSPALNWLIAGKREGAVLLVANERSRAVVAQPHSGDIVPMSENGVDLSSWHPLRRSARRDSTCRFVFVGRLIRSKSVDLWLEAFERATKRGSPMSGLIVGDGPECRSLVEQARKAGILSDRPNVAGTVYFSGWQVHAGLPSLLAQQDCLVFPTLCECGGAVLLEAMATELPVIATDWGGPADYVDPQCGILVPPDDRETFVAGFARAMEQLAPNPALRKKMGQAGRRKVEITYSWDSKIGAMIEIYRRALRRQNAHRVEALA